MSMQRKRHPLVALLACITALLPISKSVSGSREPSQRDIPPSFQEYTVQIASIRSPRIDLNSHPIGSTFPTVLRRGVRENGVNFAGSFSLVEWGAAAIVDGLQSLTSTMVVSIATVPSFCCEGLS